MPGARAEAFTKCGGSLPEGRVLGAAFLGWVVFEGLARDEQLCQAAKAGEAREDIPV